jgi:hypothetical protein
MREPETETIRGVDAATGGAKRSAVYRQHDDGHDVHAASGTGS